MTPKRPKSLKWIGEMYPDGRPARFLDFVPPEDIDEERTAALTQEQLADIRASGLYREVAQPEPKKPKPRSDSSKRGIQPRTALTGQPPASARAEAPHATESTDTGDEPTPAAEPATESEEQ